MWNTWDGIFIKNAIFAPSKPLIMTRIERITKMEALFDKSEEVIKRLEAALEDFAEIENDIAELEAYYDKDWRKDFEADEAGKLPKDLKRGVLSEDGLWNLLEDYRWLKERIKDPDTNE